MGEGHRWYDLVRYNRIRPSHPVIAPLLAENGHIWPIAPALLSQNKELTQNEYWK